MKLNIVSPTKAIIESITVDELESLKDQLSYKNLAAQYDLKRLSKNKWFRNSNPVKYEMQYNLLKSQINQCLIFEENGQKYIRPGSLPYLKNFDLQIENNINYPIPKKIAWLKPLPYQLYDYQEQSWQKLLEAKHANVSITTGGGKSAIALKLCRETGLRAAVVAPSRAIFEELVEAFEYHFGKGNIGKFGASKKKLRKRITICIADSLCNVQKNSEEWKFFSNLDMLIADESHTWASQTLENVCNGVFSEVPYRFFLSATQVRNDGGIKLLQSIIGPTVYTLSTEDAVKGGFICPHNFKIVRLDCDDPSFTSTEPLEIKRHLFLRNKNIAHFIAKLSNLLANRNEQTLILCEELSQIAMLNKLIPNSFGYAHSESNKERLFDLGLEKVDVKEQIKRFNKNEFKIFAGTSCLHVGVNIFPATNTINWDGGASEVKAKQAAVGRSIRLWSANPYKHLCGPKESVTIWDFDVFGNYVLERHLRSRIECYKESGSKIEYINFK